MVEKDCRNYSSAVGLDCRYVFALVLGAVTGEDIISFTKVSQASWFHVPPMHLPFLDYSVKFYPSANFNNGANCICDYDRHFGHVMVLNSLTEKISLKTRDWIKLLLETVLQQVIAGILGHHQ